MWGRHVVSHYFPCPVRLKVSLLSLLMKVAVGTASKCQITPSFFCSSLVSDANPFVYHLSPFMRTPAGSFAGKIPSFKLHLEPRCSLRAEVVHWEQVSSAVLGLWVQAWAGKPADLWIYFMGWQHHRMLDPSSLNPPSSFSNIVFNFGSAVKPQFSKVSTPFPGSMGSKVFDALV